MSSSARISPTAHATGHMWYRHGLSHPGLVTSRGRRYDAAFGLLTGLIERRSGFSFDSMMLTRHRGIDGQLEAAIEDGRIGQVIELAAGLSARGWRLRDRYGERIRYIETDLPHMLAEKRRLLEQADLLRPGHELAVVDVLQPAGPHSLGALAAGLDPQRGLAIITEGLMNYLSPDQADGVWRRIARTLGGFREGLYLSDFYLASEHRGWMTLAFGAVLQSFVKGRMHVHFDSVDAARSALCGMGFAAVDVLSAQDMPATREMAGSLGAQRVRVLQGRV